MALAHQNFELCGGAGSVDIGMVCDPYQAAIKLGHGWNVTPSQIVNICLRAEMSYAVCGGAVTSNLSALMQLTHKFYHLAYLHLAMLLTPLRILE